ncbi:uncharacterized protein LOC131523388 [Onychostoma macrolepis]|uniref:uncharacterized protein LOC131523388 n=1 Tax=Onychostoma macrolepis TaxID=369639 RepID=UPI00272B1FBA|nr:uncharacterized protein LOC131523388 [Onychostoma macrolepis]
MSQSHNHHRLIATHRHQIDTLHSLGHFPQSSDSRHLHLISTGTIRNHLSCKPLSGLVYTYSTDSLPDTYHCLGTLPIFCHPGSIIYPLSASCPLIIKGETFPLPSAKSALDPSVFSYSLPCLCLINCISDTHLSASFCCVTEDQTVKMQSSMETSADRPSDPFAELVNAVRLSLQPSTPATRSDIPADLVHAARQSLLLTAPATSPAASASPMARPATFTGEGEDCSGFILQVSLYFEMQSHQFTNDRARVAFIISLLSGRALQWAQSLWQANASITTSLSAFIAHFKEVFGQTASELSVHDQLFNLRQGSSSVSVYALQFRTLAAASGWNETALLTAFRQGLNADVRQLMVIYDDSMGLENFIQKTIRVSQRLTACTLSEPALLPPPAVSSVALPHLNLCK